MADGDDADLGAGVQRPGGVGVPEFAVDEDLAVGGEVGAGDAEFADDSLRAGDDFVAAGAPGNGHEEGRDQSEGKTDGQRGEQLDAHLGDGAIDQQQAAEGERDDASDGEDAVGDELCLQGEEDEGQGDERERGDSGWAEG